MLHKNIATCASSYCVSVSADVVSKADFANSSYKLERPNQPILKNYNRKQFKNNETRDFSPQLFQKDSWTTFKSSSKKTECYACQKFSNNASFSFSNWKKPERLAKHATSEIHRKSLVKWISWKIDNKSNKSILLQLDNAHEILIKQNQEYLEVIIETLIFTALQNIAQRGVDENRQNLLQLSDTNRGNFLQLLHLRSKDIPWLAKRLQNQTPQWVSPKIQNELLDIYADIIVNFITDSVQKAGRFGIIVDESTDVGN